MNLRWTCSSATSISSCSSTKKNNDISRVRILSLNCTSWSSSYNCTNLHSLGNIIRMVDFLNISCSKSDLVTIWAVSVSSTCNKLSLRKLSMNCLWYRNSRICCTCNSHCLIYICTSWQWISYSTTKTSCCATKWLNLCWMVMCLVLKVNKPFLCLSINLNRNNNWAGINLIRFFLIS